MDTKLSHRLLILLTIIIFVAMPAATLTSIAGATFSNALVYSVACLCVFVFFAGTQHALAQVGGGMLLRLYVMVSALYYIVLTFFILFRVSTGIPFDPNFFVGTWREATTTFFAVLGIMQSIGLIALHALLFIGYYFIFRRTFGRQLLPINIAARAPIGKSGFVFYMMLTGSMLLLPFDAVVYSSANARSIAGDGNAAFIPSNEQFEAQDAKENVFILQLESTNGLALDGKAVVNGKAYDDDYMPELRRAAKDGVFFPQFFGNTMQTHRAQETILCGIVNNFVNSFTWSETMRSSCLPAILSKDGYDTYFFQSYWDDNFYDTKNFMHYIGFENYHSEDIMEEGDPWYQWGYDDCTYYDRVFSFLDTQNLSDKKSLVYITVSSNHANFDPKNGYENVWAFPEPQNFIEKYLNSALVQDHCVARFYDRFRRQYADTSHLFILGDHSHPVGINGSEDFARGFTTDNYVIPLAYIPPRGRSEEFDIGKEVKELRYSQTDILATIFELLSGQQYRNSFADTLKKHDSVLASLTADQDYEDCHMFVQAFNQVAASSVINDVKYTYVFDDQSLQISNIGDDILERNRNTLPMKLGYEDFKAKYTCPRFTTYNN